jgi:hypothetical protein
MTGLEPETVRALLSALDKVDLDDGPVPRPGSPADSEAKGFSKPSFVKIAYAYGSLALASARDHLEAVDLIVRLGQPSVAHWTCLRGLLEAASIASWQLDTTIDALERVSRSLALRFSTLTQQRKMAEAEGDPSSVQKIDSRIDALETICAQMGLAPIRNKKCKRDGLGQRMPKISDLVESQYGTCLNAYRVLSSLAHCDPLVIARLGFADVAADRAGHVRKQRTVSVDDLIHVRANAVMLYARPRWMLTTQYGFDIGRTIQALERAFTDLGWADTDSVRFWRSNGLSSS